MSDVLNVEKRELLGSSHARRLRRAGKIPAILYGHGKDCLNLAVLADEVNAALRHGAKLVELKGAATDTAFFKAVQLDALGSNVLHVDLTRIEAGEAVEVTLAVELRGVAPGIKQGGAVEHVLHEVQFKCPATAIPERIEVNINSLELDQSITASDLQLPNGAELITDPSAIVATCTVPATPLEVEEEAAATEGAEPEVIGRKAEDRTDED